MKKILKGTLAFAALMSLGAMNASAKLMSAEDIENALSFNIGDVKTQEVAYIFGQYVYVNSYTIADSVAASATLNGNAPVLYYKDGAGNWSAIDVSGKESTITDKSSISIEMVKLIGYDKDGNGYVSYSDTLNTEDNVIDKGSHFDNQRVENVFNDETSPVTITSIRPVVPTSLGGTKAADDIHAYNINATSVSYTKNSLAIVENTPLMSYYNVDAKLTGKLIGLLIRTNKPMPDTFTLKIGNKTYTAKSSLLNGTKHGAKGNEFVVWVDKATFAGSNNKITFSYSEKVDGKTVNYPEQSIPVNYTEPTVAYNVTSIGGKKLTADDVNKFTATTEGANVIVEKFGEDYYAIFYGSGDKLTSSTSPIEFTYDGNNKRIANNVITDLATVKDNSVVKYTDGKTPKDYYTVSAITEDAKNKGQYIVTITTTREETAYDVVVDFGTALNSEGSPLESNTTKYKHTVNFTGDTQKDTFTATNSSGNVIVTFVLEKNIEEFKLQSVNVITNSSLTDVDPNLDAVESGTVDKAIRDNGKNIDSSLTTIEFKDKNVAADAVSTNTNIVKLQASKTLATLSEAIEGGSLSDGSYATSAKLYALILDFGVSRENITYDGASVNYAYTIGLGKKADNAKNNYEMDLSKYGITNNSAFVVVIDEKLSDDDSDTNLLKFKNTLTNVDLKVNIELNEVKVYKMDTSSTDYSLTTNDVTILNASENHITFNAAEDPKNSTFTIPDGITSFRAKVGSTEYSFTCSGTTCKKEASLKIKSVVVAKDGIVTDGKPYNQDSIDATLDGNDVINVNISRTMDTAATLTGSAPTYQPNDWFALLLKFEQKVNSMTLTPTIDGVNTEVKIVKATVSDPLLPEDEQADYEYYAILWVHSVREAGANTQTIGKVKTQEISITTGNEAAVKHMVKVNTTRIANDTDLKAVSAHTVVTGSGNTTLGALEKIDGSSTHVAADLRYNLEAVKNVTVEDGVVKIYVDKALVPTTTISGQAAGFKQTTAINPSSDSGKVHNLTLTQGTWIAVVVDLNNITNDPVSAATAIETAQDFGANSNETLVWINLGDTSNVKACVPNKTDTLCTTQNFTNADKNNIKNTATVKFEIIDQSKSLELVNHEEASVLPEILVPNDTQAYQLNQDRFDYTFESKDGQNSITINPISDEPYLQYSWTKPSHSKQNWYLIKLDFSTEVSMGSAANNATYHDGYLLIIMDGDNVKSGSGVNLTFTSKYDKAQTYKVTVKYDSTVKKN